MYQCLQWSSKYFLHKSNLEKLNWQAVDCQGDKIILSGKQIHPAVTITIGYIFDVVFVWTSTTWERCASQPRDYLCYGGELARNFRVIVSIHQVIARCKSYSPTLSDKLYLWVNWTVSLSIKQESTKITVGTEIR